MWRRKREIGRGRVQIHTCTCDRMDARVPGSAFEGYRDQGWRCILCRVVLVPVDVQAGNGRAGMCQVCE